MDDQSLQHAVVEELTWARHVDAAGITVTVHDGIVSLSGHVRTLSEKRHANRCVWHLQGVIGVRDEIAVQPPEAHRHSDAELTNRAARTLEWDALIPAGAINATAMAGVITLTGTVDEPHFRTEAEERVQQLAGVVRVDNQIVVRAPADVAVGLAEKVRRALVRHSELDSSSITVEVRGEQVTLTGSVPSFVQRRIAVNAAWAAPGVIDVVDRLQVHRTAQGAHVHA
jgi:osmotically-inducible protein OsmY